MSKPPLGAPIDRIPVHKVSPVIEGGAYPAKAVVGESIPIRATVFREGHDAVNASVVLTDPNGNERLEPMHPTTPVGFDWWTASVVLDTEGHGRSESKAGAILGRPGCTTPRSRSRRNRCFPDVHRRHCAVRSIRRRRGGSRRHAERRTRAARPRAWTQDSRWRTGWRSCWPRTFAPRCVATVRELVSPTRNTRSSWIAVRSVRLLVRVLPRSRVRGGTREPDVDIRHVRHLTRAPRGCG